MNENEILPNISVESHFVGKDVIFIVTGGLAHIGAVATAYFDEKGVTVSCKQLPHHKEGELATQMAEKAASKLQINVTVIVGIHIDNATYKQIVQLVEVAQREFDKEINILTEKN
ncbi:prenylated flavin chaperone LpdD [Clostridium saccharoperbutylacetonicum]|jgi:hypothetical protein